MSKAFVIIDYQNGVLHQPEPLDARAVLQKLQDLIRLARQRGHPVIYVQHNEAGTPFERGTPDWEFPAEIAPGHDDIVVHKQSCDAFRDTDFSERLADAAIQDIFIGGYATEFCIDTTVRRAASLGLRTTVFANAHTTRDRPFASAETIVAHHNWLWPEIINPGNPIAVKIAEGDRAFDD